MEKKLGSKVDYIWRYNLSEDRFYTYEELKSRRDENPFPDQMNNAHLRLNPELVKDFIENRLRNPKALNIDYDDPESFLPEVFMTKEEADSEMGRNYNKIMNEIEKDNDSSPDSGDQEEGEDDGEQGDDKAE